MATGPRIYVDAYDFERVADLLAKLPVEMQRVAFGRAAARTRKVLERQYARFAGRTLKVPQKLIMSRIRSSLRGGEVTLRVRSKNINLDEFAGIRQDRLGVYINGRGRYHDAFVVLPSAKRAAVHILRRRSFSGRLPTKMLFGPNPANAIDEKPADYEEMLAFIARTEMATVLMQQVAYLLGRM
ncbi:hypothetical protein [Paracoccus sp. (in: a-proteobacteria)]|uniref:hypothetical protein n=1 Tax=Paracoccus sp. TaxID=267 RepID=UPI002B003476|nr:hypothetical protein [Paracoccus sp. (in: a-proteobacteria)]